MLVAADLMKPAPITLPVTANVRDALFALSRTESRHVPLLDEAGKVAGMISDRELNDLWTTSGLVDAAWLTQFGAALEMPLEPRVAQDVLAVAEEVDLIELMELMIEYKLGALPVVDSDGQLLGVVSAADVLSELSVVVAEAAE